MSILGNMLERYRRQFLRAAKLGGPGLSGYAYHAALYCEDCAHVIIDKLAEDDEKMLAWKGEPPNDTEDCPCPSFFGEADSAQHCDTCGEYLYGPEGEDPEDDTEDESEDCPEGHDKGNNLCPHWSDSSMPCDCRAEDNTEHKGQGKLFQD